MLNLCLSTVYFHEDSSLLSYITTRSDNNEDILYEKIFEALMIQTPAVQIVALAKTVPVQNEEGNAFFCK